MIKNLQKKPVVVMKKKPTDESDKDTSDSSSSDESEEEEEEEMSSHEYRKLLASLFPSKNAADKVKAMDKLKKTISDDKKKKKTTKKAVVVEEESDDDSDYVPESEEEEEEEKQKYNIVFNIGGDEDDDDESDDGEDTEDEDEPVSSDEEEEEEDASSKKKKICDLTPEDYSVLAKLNDLAKTTNNNPLVQQCIDVCQQKLKLSKDKTDKKEKKVKDKQLRIFKKLLKDKNTDNDFEFYENMDSAKQKKMIKELREINKATRIEKPYRLSLLEADIPVQFKAAAMKKINALRYMEPGNGDYYKLKTWVDTFLKIPFNKHDNLPITIEDGVDKCHEFMADAQQTLDTAVYGMDDAKMQVMQLLGQLITNPKAVGTAVAVGGPAGTGKTSLIREGVSKILKRPFAFIPLGGAQDASFLEGHSITYEGSVWGKIVQAIIDAGSDNLVFFFDELDKLSDTAKGEEITGILMHLIDTSQNTEFHDKYFAEIKFDLSKCLFIFSWNDESKVNPILRDRMYKINTKGYDQKEKTIIANKYLLPKTREQVKFSDGDIIISEEVLHHIIDKHCEKEEGVRNLKRCLEIIHTKLNLYRLMKPGSNLFKGAMSLTVEFPYTVTKEIVDTLITSKKEENIPAMFSMYN